MEGAALTVMDTSVGQRDSHPLCGLQGAKVGGKIT